MTNKTPVPVKIVCAKCQHTTPAHPGRDVCTPCAVIIRMFFQP